MAGMCGMHKLYVPYLEWKHWARVEVYRIVPNFRGAEFSRFSRIGLEPRKLGAANEANSKRRG